MLRRTFLALFAVLLVVSFAGCGGDEPEAGSLVIYSGRSEALVAPVVERFRDATGIDVRVRYGRDAELLAALGEEGDRSEADVFWGNTSGALGAAAGAGLLAPLPDTLLARPSAYASSSGLWVPVTVRFRVLAYNPAAVSEASLPTSVLDLPDLDSLRGRIGWTPTYSSFQDFVAALDITQGREDARGWIDGMKALEPKAYPSNTPMLEALIAGELDVALTNHYYVRRITEGEGANADAVAIHRFAPGDVGNLALVTGAGRLTTGTHEANALRFLRFLLSDEAQTMLAENVHEYPVLRSATVPAYLLPFDEAVRLSPRVDFEQQQETDTALRLLRDADLL